MFDNILNAIFQYCMYATAIAIGLMLVHKGKLLFDFYVEKGCVPFMPEDDLRYSDPAMLVNILFALIILGGGILSALIISLVIVLFKTITLWWVIGTVLFTALICLVVLHARVCRKKHLVVQALKGE